MHKRKVPNSTLDVSVGNLFAEWVQDVLYSIDIDLVV